MSLNWDEAQDDVGVYEYEVHRAEVPDFAPSRQTRIAVIHDNYYEDRAVQPEKTYYYRVVARDLGGYTAVSEPVKHEAPPASSWPSSRGTVSRDEF